MRFLLCVLLSGLTAGCDYQEGVNEREEYRSTDRTPAGFHVVFHDAGLLASGLVTREQIYAAFDAAFLRSALSLQTRFGIPVAQTYAVPHNERMQFVLVDHYLFAVPEAGPDLYATGEYREGRIAVAMHPRSHVERGVAVPSNALPWTLITGPVTGRTYYGTLDLDGAFPALEHELGHHFFGPNFEH